MSELGVALRDSIRDFVGEVSKPTEHQPGEPFFTVMRQAIVKAVGAWSGSAPTVSIAFPEDPPGTSIPDVKVLHPYVPQVGDTVWAARMGPDLLVVSKMRGSQDYVTAGQPHQSPSEDFSSQGPNAGYNLFDRTTPTKRYAWYASAGSLRLGNGGTDLLNLNHDTGVLQIPVGQLQAQSGATVTGGQFQAQAGAAITGATSVTGGKATLGAGFEIDSTGTLDSTAVRMFDTSGSLFLQAGTGRNVWVRDENAGVTALFDTNNDRLGVARAGGLSFTGEFGGDLFATGQVRGTTGGTGAGIRCRSSGNTLSWDWDGTALHFLVDSTDQIQVTHGSKTFVIEHPSKKDHWLVHACVEGPESAVFYRGEERTTRGRKVVRLPSYFESLVREEGRTVQLTQILDDEGDDLATLAATVPKDGKFVVRSSAPSVRFSWEVKAVRADVEELDVEVPVGSKKVVGWGPYRHIFEHPPEAEHAPTLSQFWAVLQTMAPGLALPDDLEALYDEVRAESFRVEKIAAEWELFWFPSMDAVEEPVWRAVVAEEGFLEAERRRDVIFRALAEQAQRERDHALAREWIAARGVEMSLPFVLLG